MAEFSSLDNNQPNIPLPVNSNTYGLELTNPDNVLSGTNRGTQFVGSASLQIDSTQNLITVKGGTNNANNVLRFGQVSNNFLGMAVNNGTVDTMFAGQDSSGNTVVKVAKTGFDAKTATNDQLVFNSGQNTFKIVKTVPITLLLTLNASAATHNTSQVAHGLTFTPAYLAYLNLDPSLSAGFGIATRNVHNPYTQFAIAGGTTLQPQLWVGVTVDSTNVNYEVICRYFGTDTLTFTATVYLMQETQTA